MNAWLLQHFFNPAFVAGGAALIASPIIIHLINRLRFKKVRFAAMEFLLQSQQRNRRRVLLEQLLLLLLRILIIIAIVMLIARLILDPSQLSLFRGAQAHHVVLLDDSGSMKNQWGETTAFDEGLNVIQKLVAEGARRPGTQKFSLILLSNPDATYSNFNKRTVDESLLIDISDRFESLRTQCTNRQLSLSDGLNSARQLLNEDKATIRHLHVISDFRSSDWLGKQSLTATVKELDDEDVTVNLVKTVPEHSKNLAVTSLSGGVESAAVGIPVRLTTSVANYSETTADAVSLTVKVDGVKLPITVNFPKIEPGKEVTENFDLVFNSPRQYQVSVEFSGDSLEQDNARYLAIDVSNTNQILIVDGTRNGEEGQYVADAISADPEVTGFTAIIDGVDYLRKNPIDKFAAIYMVNVPELAPDGQSALEEYVRNGGGLCWFMGTLTNPAFYNDKLYSEDPENVGLFPIKLGKSPATLIREDGTSTPDLALTDHPTFTILNVEDGWLTLRINIFKYLPTSDDWEKDDTIRNDRVKTIARLRDKQPFIFEHKFGKGTVITCLSSAGPMVTGPDERWNNWPTGQNATSYTVFHLQLGTYVMRKDRQLPAMTVGEQYTIQVDPGNYLDKAEVTAPETDNNRVTPIQLAPTKQTAKVAASDSEGTGDESSEDSSDENEEPTELMLVEKFRQTNAPGVYKLRLFNHSQEAEERLLTFNVPVEESLLGLASSEDLRDQIGTESGVTIQEPGSLQWLQGEEAGSEVRMFLIGLLILLLIAEQAMAYRLSYHDKPVPRAPLKGAVPA